MEKQMGCMAGFLHLFDRHQMIAGKRSCSSKILAPVVDSSSSSAASGMSPPATPVKGKIVPAETEIIRSSTGLESPKPSYPSLNVRTFEEGIESPWKFREAPRLSFDSRVHGKGYIIQNSSPLLFATERTASAMDNHLRAPNVIARLMGLETLPDSGLECFKKAELRRSASESRVSHDLIIPVTVEGVGFQYGHCPLMFRKNLKLNEEEQGVQMVSASKSGNMNQNTSWSSHSHRRVFFDSQDFFPEPSRRTASLLDSKEKKRVKLRRNTESSNDMEALKEILEALHLKGLLRSKKSSMSSKTTTDLQSRAEPTCAMKQSKLCRIPNGRTEHESIRPLSSRSSTKCRAANRRIEGGSRTVQEPRSLTDLKLRGRRPATENRLKNLRTLRIDVEKQIPKNSVEQKRVTSPRRISNCMTSNRSPRTQKVRMDRMSATEEEVSSVLDGNTSTRSQAESKSSKREDYDGRSLLERCDKLINSIADITANDQPSPVSVLNSSLFQDEGSPPLIPLIRCIDFEEAEEEQRSAAVDHCATKSIEDTELDDFGYVSELMQAFDSVYSRGRNARNHIYDVFARLEEKFQSHNRGHSSSTRVHRRLVFDSVIEILQRKQQVNSWKAFTAAVGKPTIGLVWRELKRMEERTVGEDVCEVVCGIIQKDMSAGAGDGDGDGWEDRSAEMSQVVLDIERLIFKDLVGGTINDLAAAIIPTR